MILTAFLNTATTSLGTSNFDAVLGAISRLKLIFLLSDVSLPILNSTIPYPKSEDSKKHNKSIKISTLSEVTRD